VLLVFFLVGGVIMVSAVSLIGHDSRKRKDKYPNG
jgi:hypothetical protein